MKHINKIKFICLSIIIAVLLSELHSGFSEMSDSISIGDSISFGHYEQDNNLSNGKEEIYWRVLAVKDNGALLLSQQVLDNQPFNDAKADTTWEYSSLRIWLNSDFIQEAFSVDEQASIEPHSVVNSKDEGNAKWDTKGRSDTIDQVFLLSYQDIARYFSNSKAVTVTPTKYSKKRGASEWFTSNCTWWLRSPGRTQDETCYVNTKGEPGSSSAQDKRGVRPAIWIDLKPSNTNDHIIAETIEPTSTPKPTVEPTNTPEPTIADITISRLEEIHGLEFKRGSKGEAVKAIQQMLINLLYLSEGQADGAFGKKTEEAVIRFQEASGLKSTGIVTVATQYVLAEKATGFSADIDHEWEYAGLDYYGVIRFKNSFYVGLIQNKQDYKEGTFFYDEGISYAGKFKNNLRSGKGDSWFPNGDHYSGEWANDTMNGKGVYYFGNENATEKYDGEWVDGKMSGRGTYTLSNGKKVKGKWQDNRQIGW